MGRAGRRAIGRTATERLIASGHRHIVHLSIQEPGPATDGRSIGYRAAMVESGLEPVVVLAAPPANARAGRAAAEEALALLPAMTAVFTFNDAMAMGVYQMAAQRGVRVPEDLSVVGVDNLEVIAAQLQPGLTTMGLPHYEMGRWAIEQLATMVSNGEVESSLLEVRLQCQLIERGSVATAPR